MRPLAQLNHFDKATEMCHNGEPHPNTRVLEYYSEWPH